MHEFGHFLAAKMRGLKVLRFSIGFGPKLFSWTGKDGCKYMVSLLPLGGYVALPQLADMGSLEGGDGDDDDALKNLPPASCTDKVIVSAAGAFFNILFAVLLAAVIWLIGLPSNSFYDTNQIGYIPETITNADGSKIPSPARAAGLKVGDKILSIDGRKIKNFSEILEVVALGSGRDQKGVALAALEIERDGKVINLNVAPVLVSTNISTGDAIRMLGVSPAMKMKVGAIMKDSPAQKAGIKVGDEVLEIDGTKVFSQQHMADCLEKIGDDKTVNLKILREGKEILLPATPKRVARTKPLCEVSIGDGGKIEFITSSLQATKGAAAAERVKVFSSKIDNPFFENIFAGDLLYAVDGKKISNITQLNALLNHIGGKNKIKLSFMSQKMELKDVFLPLKSTSKILSPKERIMLGYILESSTSIHHPSISEQFKEAITRTYDALASLINPKSDVGISSLAGPVDIGRVIYKLSLQDISLVLSFAVLLNINLAFLNMLPIPVLDGGHIMFALISRITGRKIPSAVFAVIQGTFSILFITLMVYVVYIGVMRWSGDSQMERDDRISSEYYINNISFKNHE